MFKFQRDTEQKFRGKQQANATFTNGIQDGINTVACSFDILFLCIYRLPPKLNTAYIISHVFFLKKKKAKAEFTFKGCKQTHHSNDS